eukprot:403342583
MSPVDQFNFIVNAITQFLIYLALNTDFRNDMFMASYRLTEAFVLDVVNVMERHDKPEAYGWSIDQQVIARGFMFEQHKITTEDGYILTAFRIPGKLNEIPSSISKKQPVYMQHGLIDDGGTWLFNDASIDLSLILADKGYDVWITNSRGTVYSNQHIKYTTRDQEYWEFSMHEMGKYDVPANLNYILDKTGHEQVIYIGHSQGTTQWFIANALYDDLHKHFKAFIGLAPVMFVEDIPSIAAKMLDLLRIPDLFYEHFNHILYLPNLSSLGQPLLRTFPRTSWNVVQAITGFDDNYHIDLANLPMMAQNDVGGTSTKNTLHWIQMIRDKRFQMFDYGERENREKYGQNKPPEYDYKNFKKDLKKVKILLFYGNKDSLMSEDTFMRLLKVLPMDTETVEISDYNHVDYMWAEDCNKYVNDYAVDFIQRL